VAIFGCIMGTPNARSILYRLIEAGQLARQALLVPLIERGLEAGDDAVLLLLRDEPVASEADLCAALGLERAALQPRLERLAHHGVIERRAVGSRLVPMLVLTDRGRRIGDSLAAKWSTLERAMLAGLRRKERRDLRKRLGRVVETLRS
jgi:DNA-binding MarR family transcriptional regulator